MAERNKSTQAIILTARPQGENNKIITYLSPENGICTAMLYGGPKSKLKSLIQPFNSGILYYYEDEVKKSSKINDFDVSKFHESFHSSLYKMWASNLAAEIVLKTKCAGDWSGAWTLLTAFTDGIDMCDEKESKLGTLRFLWRYLGLMGVQPDVFACQNCENEFSGKESAVYYQSVLSGFLCQDCMKALKDNYSFNQNLVLDGEALSYLQAMQNLSPGKVRSISIKAESVFQLKNLLFYLIENAAGTKFKSLESGMGIL